MGLTLNVKKTECMVIKYLGYMITSDGKCRTEIKKRISEVKSFDSVRCTRSGRHLASGSESPRFELVVPGRRWVLGKGSLHAYLHPARV